MTTADQLLKKTRTVKRQTSSFSSSDESDRDDNEHLEEVKPQKEPKQKRSKQSYDKNEADVNKEKLATIFCSAKDGSKLVLFKTGYSPLRNFYPRAPFTINEEEFQNVEQWVQANKADWFDDKETREMIMGTKSAREAKVLGQNIDESDEKASWVKEIVKLTRQGIEAKVNQNNNVEKLLRETGTATIAEASKFNKFWTTGVDLDSKHVLNKTRWTGQNVMGKVLMKIRKSL